MSVALRIVPSVLLGRDRGLRLVERNAVVYRRQYMLILSGLVEPLFFLLGLGYGLGSIVGSIPGPGGVLLPYAVFVGPALLAQSSMNGAITESTYNVFARWKFEKLYDAILTTPLGVMDIAVGEIASGLLRGTLYAVGFFAVMLLLGLVRSPLGILMIPAAVLVGWAFAAVGMAATTWMRSWQDFDMIQLVILPLFLFSGVFYPLSAYPEALQVVVEWTPLYQGVDLIRSLTVGYVGPELLVHVAYLGIMGVVGLAVTARRFDLLLRP